MTRTTPDVGTVLLDPTRLATVQRAMAVVGGRPGLDRLTRAAVLALDAAAAALSLVDDRRELVLSVARGGASGDLTDEADAPSADALPWTAGHSVPAERSVAARVAAHGVVHRGEPLVVDGDAFGERGTYAGAPLVDAAGVVLGALVVAARTPGPRGWSDVELRLLQELAGAAAEVVGRSPPPSTPPSATPSATAAASDAADRLYRSLFELNPDAIAHVALDGRFISGNAAFERVTGYESTALAGQPFDPLVVPEHRSRVRRLFQLAVRGTPQYFEYAITHREGHRVEVSGAKLPVYDADGRVVGILGLGRDVTARRRTAEGIRFLSDAGRALAGSLDYETTLRTVARLACPTLADFCVVDVIQEDGGVQRLAAAHADPACDALVRELCRFPPDPGADGGISFVLNSGRPLLVADFGEGDILAGARNEEHAQLIRDLGPHSVMSVPLVARDRTIGAVTLSWSRPGMRYGARELALAEEMAARAALAVDNARLYREVYAELAERERAEATLRRRGERLAAIVAMQHEMATAALDPAALLRRVCEGARELTRADGAAAAIVEGDEVVYRAGCGTGEAYVGMRFGSDAPSGATLGAGGTLHSHDSEADPRVNRDAMRLTGSRSTVMVPLVYNRAMVGILGVVARAPGAFDDDDADAMRLVAGMLAAALSHATEFAAKQALLAERTAALSALRASEERYALVSKATNDVIYDWDVLTGALFWSAGIFTALGHDRRAVAPTLDWWTEQIHPADRGRVLAALDAVVKTAGSEFFTAEYRFRRGDAGYAVVLDRGYLVRDERGTAVRMIGSMSDTTERRRAEEALRTSEERFRSLIENASDPIAILDAGGVFRYASPAHERALGRRPEELVGTNAFGHLHPDDAPMMRERFAALLASPGASVAVQFRFRHAGGGWRTLAAIARNLLDDPAVRGVVINSRDVTEQSALETRLLQAQKMEAIGNLAGGVAHDFNNVLTVIRSFSELAVRTTPAGDSRREDLEEIRRAADRGAALVRQLLAFSRRQMLQPQLLGVGQVVAGVEGMLRSLIGEDVRLVTRLADAPRRVHADRVQMEQVLLNLAVNARDAMPGGGTLTIETGAAARGADGAAGDWVVLRVRDTGHGMTPEVRARVFEPFFTTKPPGRGTGLGLSTVYGIVEQSGGQITLETDPGHGTAFTIHLPSVAAAPAAPPLPGPALGPPAAAAAAAAPTLTAGPPPGRPGDNGGGARRATVLLVEDDAAVRALASRVLRDAAFDVLEAGSGEEALRLCAGREDAIDLLLTDVVMPGMSGRELVERAAVRLPRTRVLYMSGYTDDEIIRRGLRDDRAELLEKPFTPGDLVGKVREVLKG